MDLEKIKARMGKGEPFSYIRLDHEITANWMRSSPRPLMLDVPSMEGHPIRSLSMKDAKILRDWLDARIGEAEQDP